MCTCVRIILETLFAPNKFFAPLPEIIYFLLILILSSPSLLWIIVFLVFLVCAYLFIFVFFALKFLFLFYRFQSQWILLWN